MLVPTLLALSGAVQLVSAGSWCSDSYWTGQCTLCPGYWYQTCRNGYAEVAEKACGFWNAGCMINCRNDRHAYNHGCGCGAGTSCLNVDCAVSGWSEYGSCSATCGGGRQTRTRTITRQQAYDGAGCPPLSQWRECATNECPVHCDVSQWTLWNDCSRTCGDGTKSRFRFITRDPLHGGTACPELQETITCNLRECAIHCDVSEWSAYSECSESCGVGSQTRTRSVTQDPMHGGDECPDLEETIACKLVDCPVHCEVGEFGDYDSCTATCGEGTKTRTRSITQEALHGGNECPALSETISCTEGPCPVDCVVSEFGDFGNCDATCGPGTQTRERTITTAPLHNGAECPNLVEEQSCQVAECPIDCAVSLFDEWTACSETCGDGLRTRSRTITQDALHGGALCPNLVEEEVCNVAECPGVPVHCEVSEWGQFSECSESCGDGTKTHHRTVVKAAEHNGDACPPLVESIACKIAECPVDCVVSDFTEWGSCDVTCGEGTHTRTRTIVTGPLHGGAECPDLEESQLCMDAECPVDCLVSEFGEWGECSESCGPGTMTRSRSVTREALHGGAVCPDLEESMACPEQEPCDCTTQAAYEARCGWDSANDEATCTTGYGCNWTGEACQPHVPVGKKPIKVKCKKLVNSKCLCYTGCKLKTKKGKTKCKGTHKFRA